MAPFQERCQGDKYAENLFGLGFDRFVIRPVRRLGQGRGRETGAGNAPSSPPPSPSSPPPSHVTPQEDGSARRKEDVIGPDDMERGEFSPRFFLLSAAGSNRPALFLPGSSPVHVTGLIIAFAAFIMKRDMG